MDSCIVQANYYLNINLDSALYFADKAKKQLNETDLENGARVHGCLGDAYSAMGNMNKALESYLHAKRLNDEVLENKPENVDFIMQIDIREAQPDRCSDIHPHLPGCLHFPHT